MVKKQVDYSRDFRNFLVIFNKMDYFHMFFKAFALDTTSFLNDPSDVS